MSNQQGPPRRRRERTVFHYKVDELLRADDRDPYLTLLGDPRTRNEDAHRWLTHRGYILSLSAVARHRRRLLKSQGEQRAEIERAEMFARAARSAEAPDFAAGAKMQLQHLVFQHLMELDEHAQIGSEELLRLSKLVGECVKMEAQRPDARKTQSRPSAEPAPAPQTDEELKAKFEMILFGKTSRETTKST